MINRTNGEVGPCKSRAWTIVLLIFGVKVKLIFLTTLSSHECLLLTQKRERLVKHVELIRLPEKSNYTLIFDESNWSADTITFLFFLPFTINLVCEYNFPVLKVSFRSFPQPGKKALDFSTTAKAQVQWVLCLSFSFV